MSTEQPQRLEPLHVYPSHHGLVGYNYPPDDANVTQIASGGFWYFLKVHIPLSVNITGCRLGMSPGGTTLTTGQCWAGLYDSTGSRIALTADQKTNWEGAGGTRTCAFTSSVTVLGGPSVFVWVALVANGSTIPTFWCKAATGGTLVNEGLTAATARYANSAAGSKTTLPTSITPGTDLVVGGRTFWVGLQGTEV